MQAYLHRSEQRGHVQAGWLNSYHSFSFGSWYNKDLMGVSALRVINEDTIKAGHGFATHPHENMEILTCVLSGDITHQDSMGNHGKIGAGEWQLMSAGKGVQHSEINDGDEMVHLLQIWLKPNIYNAEPSYQQIACDPNHAPNHWHLIAGSSTDAPMFIRQDAAIYTAVVQQQHSVTVHAQHGVNYVHVIKGSVQIAEYSVHAGDALLFSETAQLTALNDAQLIWFDLP